MSGVGKGIATASIGKILQAKGFKVNPIKIDPYLNVDAGTMNPTEHGEVFVLNSGLETDQDMGNYERFMDLDLKSEDYITSGMVYKHVIEKERNLGYRGKCVEAIPHITDEISRKIQKSADLSGSDITLIEIGGTVGDYQNIMFIEAARVLRLKNPNDVIFILVSFLPIPSSIGEMKTRPTQTAVRMLNSYGVQPDIVIARSEKPLDKKRKEKIAVSCNVLEDHVISAPDIASVYDVPINFEKDDLGEIILRSLELKGKSSRNGLSSWKKFVAKTKRAKTPVNIAIAGKYFDSGDFVLSDAYISVIEAIKFSAYHELVEPKITWLDTKNFEVEPESLKDLKNYDGVIIPGGFGSTGIEGKINAIKYLRENKIPFFGLCYGMQLAVIEFARNVLKLNDAHTVEVNPNTPHPVIDIMPEQKELLKEEKYGATMRLGAYPCRLREGMQAREFYGMETISERHRHRYEVNPEYVDRIFENGLLFSGTSPDGRLMEICELPRSKHPFFLGTQFHPEFQAHPLNPHPLFSAFVKAAKQRSKNRK